MNGVCAICRDPLFVQATWERAFENDCAKHAWFDSEVLKRGGYDHLDDAQYNELLRERDERQTRRDIYPRVMRCGHAFHHACVERWHAKTARQEGGVRLNGVVASDADLTASFSIPITTCPVCRATIGGFHPIEVAYGCGMAHDGWLLRPRLLYSKQEAADRVRMGFPEAMERVCVPL